MSRQHCSRSPTEQIIPVDLRLIEWCWARYERQVILDYYFAALLLTFPSIICQVHLQAAWFTPQIPFSMGGSTVIIGAESSQNTFGATCQLQEITKFKKASFQTDLI